MSAQFFVFIWKGKGRYSPANSFKAKVFPGQEEAQAFADKYNEEEGKHHLTHDKWTFAEVMPENEEVEPCRAEDADFYLSV